MNHISHEGKCEKTNGDIGEGEMKKVKWGVIGAGGIADRRTIPGMLLAENAELVAVMEVNMDLAEKIRTKYNVKKAYDSVEVLLADPEVEAVYIASPVVFHKEQAIMAARAKKHVLIEKPIALTVEDGRKVLDVCRMEGVLAATGFMMRFHAYHQVMKKMIADGKLGQVVSCRAQLTCWYPDMPGAWRQVRSQSGGGALMDLAVHCIDLIQYVTGGKAVKVAALAGTKTFSYEVDDSGILLFELDNGANCMVDVNFNIPDDAGNGRFEIYGTKGSMLAEGTIGQVEGGKLDVMISGDTLAYDANQDHNDVVPLDIRADFGNMYAKEIEAFGNSILNGTAVDVPAQDGLQVQKIIELAYESSRLGTFLKI
jgi:predicted dehydrogenase